MEKVYIINKEDKDYGKQFMICSQNKFGTKLIKSGRTWYENKDLSVSCPYVLKKHIDTVFENNPKQDKIDRLYLRMAFIWAENSYAIRRQVGCLIVKDNSIISDGYNGTPSGFPNVCEYAVAPDEGQSYCTSPDREDILACYQNGWELVSYPIVLHAESNAIAKLAKSGNSSKGATIYITDEPCIDCAKLIIQAGIKRVVFSREYRKHEGIELLNQTNIIVKQINI